MSKRSKVRVGDLRTVFPLSGTGHDANRLHASLARLCVLHEDLRLEIIEIHEMPRRTGEFTPVAHRLYFWRRAIATLQEFSATIVDLDKQTSFTKIRRSFDPQQLTTWKRAVQHFKELKHRLKQVRNDVGGHFGLEAAKFALEQLAHDERSSPIGRIEICDLVGKGRASEYFHTRLRLHFAKDIALGAMIKASKTRDQDDAMKEALGELWVESHRHACNAVSTIVSSYLWGRFG